MKKILMVLSILIVSSLACSLPRLTKIEPAPDPTATQKPIIEPTLNPTSTESAKIELTSTPTLTPEATAAQPDVKITPTQGALIFSDDFSSDRDLWYIANEDEVAAEISGGAYIMQVKKDHWMLWSESSWLDFSNIRIDVDATLLAGSENNTHGILCRYQDTKNFYYLGIGNDGFAEIYKTINGEQTELFGEYSDQVIDPKSNHITAMCQDNMLSLFVDESLIASVEDENLKSGDAGLYAATFNDTFTSISFDNFEAYDIVDDSPNPISTERPQPSGLRPELPFSSKEVFSDDFSSAGKWDSVFDSDMEVYQQDGLFFMNVYSANWLVHSVTNLMDLADVIVDVDAYRAYGPITNDQGVVCRALDTENFYALTLGNDGYVSILKYVDGIGESLYAEFHEGLVDKDINHITATCIGSELSIYSDGNLLASASDSDLIKGDVGLVTGSYDDLPVMIEYDNFTVNVPE